MSINVNSGEREDVYIHEILLKSTRRIKEAILDEEAPRLPGFLPIKNTRFDDDSTEYIAHSSIESFTIGKEEMKKTAPSYYFTPDLKVKVESR